jgi:hypothetical protein
MRRQYVVRILALALLVCALPSLALASATRIQSLGLQGDYILDNANVHTYPSAIVRYQNLIYGDLGVKDAQDGNDDISDFEDNNANPRLTDADRALGAILGNIAGGSAGTFGIFINENVIPMSPALGAQYFNRNANEALNLIWGYRLSSMALGLELNYSQSEFEEDPFKISPFPPGGFVPFVPANNSRQLFNSIAAGLGSSDWNTLGFGGGVSFDFGAEQANFVDVSAEYRSHTFEVSDATPGAELTFEDDGGAAFAINARARIQAGSMWLVPVANYYTMDFSTQFTDAADPANNLSADNSVDGFNIGIDTQWELRDGDWFHLGVAVQSVSMDYQDFDVRDPDPDGEVNVEYSATPNLFAALESNLWPWLTLRLGASKPIFGEAEIEDNTGGTPVKTTLSDSPLQYALGLGFHLGRIDIDALMNQDFAFTGSWLASGNSEIPFTRLTATYRW